MEYKVSFVYDTTGLDMNREPTCLGWLCYLFGLIVAASSGVTNNSNLHFGVFISQESDFDFSGFIPPLELGVDTINNHTNVLKGLNERNYHIEFKPITNGKVSLQP